MRKAIVFSLDAMMAFLLLVTTVSVIMLFSYSSVSPEFIREGLHDRAADAVNLLSSLRVQDVRREPYVIQLFDEGALSESDLDKTLVEVVGEFWAANNTANSTAARELVRQVFSRVMPQNVQWAVLFEQDVIYNTSALAPEHSLASSKRLVSGLNRSAPSTGCVSRAFLQRIRGRQDRAYYFFGGFVGQGNITAVVQGVPGNASVEGIYVELNAGDNFTLRVNGLDCGIVFNKTEGAYVVDNWTLDWNNASACVGAVKNGSNNNFSINFTGSGLSNAYVGGGFISVIYNTSDFAPPQETVQRDYLPGISGVANYYGSFYVPGTVTNASARLRFLNNYSTFFMVGNRTLFNQTNGSESVQTISIPDLNFSQAFPDYAEISMKTIPVRFGVEANITGMAGADVILIIDGSESMNSSMNSTLPGIERGCDNPLLFDNDTKRLSVAKCIAENFTQTMLNYSENRVAIVPHAPDADVNWTWLSNDFAFLNGTIHNISVRFGTCIACAINRGYNILSAQSTDPTRIKTMIVMSDGRANYRATPKCNNLYAVSSNRTPEPVVNPITIAGLSGLIGHRSSDAVWQNLSSSTSNTLRGVSIFNSSRGYAVGDYGTLIKWDGSSWTNVAPNPVSAVTNLTGVSVLNTSGFAVGYNITSQLLGVTYRLVGDSWSYFAPSPSNLFNQRVLTGVSMLNSTFGFAVGYRQSPLRGYIYQWDGSAIGWPRSWSIPNTAFNGISVYNGTIAFVVGTGGIIYRWTGSTWAGMYSGTTSDLFGVHIYNGSLAYAVGANSTVLRWKGTTWGTVDVPIVQNFTSVQVINSSLVVVTSERGAIIELNGTGGWEFNSRFAPSYSGTNTLGVSCDTASCNFTPTFSSANANYSSCRAHDYYNTTLHAVGFAVEMGCSFADLTLQGIADCGNGTYFRSQNASELAEFYSELAASIIEETESSQLFNVTGNVTTILFPDSYLEFNYTPAARPFGYREIALDVETPPLSSCEGAAFIPQQLSVDEFRVSSYSGANWTSNVSLYSSLASIVTGGGWLNVFNLSSFNSTSFTYLGDPFFVEFNASLVPTGEWSNVSIRTAGDPFSESTACSQDNRIFYAARLVAAVNYSTLFFECFSHNVTVYYDSDYDRVADGYANVTIGAGLPSAGEAYVNVSDINYATDGVSDAFVRLLNQINFFPNETTNPSGSSDNPVDIALSNEVSLQTLTEQGIPFMWGPSEVRIIAWE